MKRPIFKWVLAGGWFAAAVAVASAATTINTPNEYAYGANIGWLDARGNITNGAAVGQYFCTGCIWSANCGWISLGNGPTNGWNYSNASATDWGVNHDCAGYLWGYAYGANIGWITFEQSWGRPRIDLLTGNLSGYAWSGNIGWISLSNVQAHVQTDAFASGPDSDGDGLPDPWELSRVGSLGILSGGAHDQDGDGATDTEEYGADTDPAVDIELFEIVSYSESAGTLQWTTRPTRLYQVEATNQMPAGVSGAWEEFGTRLGPFSDSPHETSLPGIPNTTHVFRVKAFLPLTASP